MVAIHLKCRMHYLWIVIFRLIKLGIIPHLSYVQRRIRYKIYVWAPKFIFSMKSHVQLDIFNISYKY
jgi:hypothetical protein